MTQHEKVKQISHTKLDIIGDIHGEINALNTLLQQLGYDEVGRHPDDRHLVFVGDLIDRGWNSWAVFQKVSAMMENGLASCVLGNHELNLIVPAKKGSSTPKMKGGNNWFHGAIELVDAKDITSIQPQYLLTSDNERAKIQHFCHALPLAIEGPGIRVVHACWNHEAIQTLRKDTRPILEVYQDYAQQCDAWFLAEGQQRFGISSKQEIKAHIKPEDNPNKTMAELNINPLYYDLNDQEQNKNPIKLITSGPESPVALDENPYLASKKLRYFKRDPWWTKYDEEELVVIGHYWRAALPKDGVAFNNLREDEANIPPVFPNELENQTFHQLLGPRKNVMCVDYAVGKCFLERHHKIPLTSSGALLGALRYEYDAKTQTSTKRLFLHDGQTFEL